MEKGRLRIKENKGITLIALVITVIVLLILAGVAISAIVGEDGIFNKAKYSAEKYNNAAQNEVIAINEIISKVEDEFQSEPKELSENALIGQYVYYEGKAISNYTSAATENGVSEQKFYAEGYSGLYDPLTENGGWVILTNDTTNSVIELVSASTIGDLSLRGMTAFYNSVYILNNISEIFINTDYAISGRCIGSNVDNPRINDKNTSSGYSHNDINYISDLNALKNANIDKLKNNYWLASRYHWNDGITYAYYLRYINSSGELKQAALQTYNSDSMYTGTAGVRPVIKLKQNIKYKSGDGTPANPYILVSK